jgi:hypothetical protein
MGFASSTVLAGMLCLFALALILTLVGSIGTLDLMQHYLDKRRALLRNLASVCLLLALLSVPVLDC